MKNIEKRLPPRHLESKLQQACVSWFRYQHPKLRENLFAIPNGGYRSNFEASIMTGEGVTPGIPDLMLAVVTTKYPGLFIEMKFGKNKPNDNQQRIMSNFQRQGYKCVVCWTLKEFVDEVTAYLAS